MNVISIIRERGGGVCNDLRKILNHDHYGCIYANAPMSGLSASLKFGPQLFREARLK